MNALLWIGQGALAVVMIGAIASHGRLAIVQHKPREWGNVAANVVILTVCVLVAVGRLAA